MARITPLLVLLILFLDRASLSADDWPQWRGPARNGTSREDGWLVKWPADGNPPVAWRVRVGKGHSAVSVQDGLAYTMGWDGKEDTVFCLDVGTGRIRWSYRYPCAGILQWPGPRSTPTVADDTVYTLGQHGQLHALDARSGRVRWKVQLPPGYNPDVDYGFAWSPLVEGNLLILGAGSKGLALRTKDGSFAWGNDGRHGACASPVPYTWQGKRGVAVISTDPGRDSVSLVGVDPATGAEQWRHGPWNEKWGAACVDLLIADGKVFVTTAEQFRRFARLSMEDGRLKEDWANNHLPCYTGTCVLHEGHVYGVSQAGMLKCLDWKTGEERWSQRGFGNHGSLILADGKLIVLASRGGKVTVVEATPAGFKPLRTAQAFAGDDDTFTAPVLAGGHLYCRSYAGEVVCFRLR